MHFETMVPQRIGIIGNQAFSVVNFRLPLMRTLVQYGHTVYAIAPDFDASNKAALEAEGITAVSISLSRTGLNPIRDLGDAARLGRILKALQLDAVLSFAIKPVIYGTLAARWAGIPSRYALIAGLGYAFGESEEKSVRRTIIRWTASFLYRIALGQAERVFMQNPDDLEEFASTGIVPINKMVHVNGTGVELDQWPVLPPIVQPPTFILAARLLKEKGVYDFVAAARIIKKSFPSARFVLLGGLDSNPSGIQSHEVDSWVSDGLIEWPGHVPVRDWLGKASVFVLPSYYREGVPRSIQEAMASGRPIITTDMPGCRETVVHGRNGFLVAPRDPVVLAGAMQRFIEEPALIGKMGVQSRALAEERFDVDTINGTMITTMKLNP